MQDLNKLLISVMKTWPLNVNCCAITKMKGVGERSHGSLHFLIMTQIQLHCTLVLYRATGNCSNRVTALVIKTCSLCNIKMLLSSQEMDDGLRQKNKVTLS